MTLWIRDTKRVEKTKKKEREKQDTECQSLLFEFKK